ncbi:MAG TPA: CHASE3 domain-containing protein [Chthoniobacter sp.]|jgi:methyl-accepting chemotaxis protein
MKWNVGTKLGLGFGLAVVIFAFVGAMAFNSIVQLLDDSQLRKHSFELLGRLDETLSYLKDTETGQRGYLLTGEDTYLEPYQVALGKVDQDLQDLRKLTADNPRQQHRLDTLEPLVAERLASAKKVIDTYRSKTSEAAIQIIKTGADKAVMDEIRKVIGEMQSEEEELLAKRTEETQLSSQRTKWTIGLGTGVAIILAAIAGFLITQDIAQPLRGLTRIAERITAGDLNVKVPSNGRSDEVGLLSRAFDQMTKSLGTVADTAEQIANGDLRTTIKPQSADDILGNAFARMSLNLREQIGALGEGANVLGSAASEIVAATTQLAASATESATAVSETTTTVEEVRQTAQIASDKAKYVSDTAQKAAQISSTGRKSAQEVGEGIVRIRQQMEAIAASMMQLSEQSQSISQIIAVVEDLASQSNLLAVNAAIEAAKAGEQGKGFNVVAQEVKSLADQSRAATNQIRTILGDIQKATTAAVLVTEQGNRAVEVGERQTSAAGESIHALAGSVSEAAQAATQIAASSQQQLVGVDQVARAMENIKQASTQNVSSAKQLEVSARNLNELGHRLKEMIERYKF